MATVPLAPSRVLPPRTPLPAPDRVLTTLHLLMLVTLYAVPVIVCLQPGIDWDLWWHLRVGEYVVKTGTVPHHDPFSAFGQDKPWVAYSWLFEVLVYELHRAFGLAGAIIYQTVLALTVVAAVHRLVARREPRFLVATALTAAGVLALAALFKQRPWMFTILFTTLTLDVVLDLRVGRKNRLTWLLPLLYVLWANIHIQFIYGLFILGLACVAPLIDRFVAPSLSAEERGATSGKSVWLLTALCTLATLVNPYHVRLYFVVVEYATQSGPFRFVHELMALEFREISDWVMLALAAAATFTLGRRQRLSSFDVLLLAATAFFAFRARRDLWFLVVAALAVLTSSPLFSLKEECKEGDDSSARLGFTWPRAAFVCTAVALLMPAVWRMRGLSDRPPERSHLQVVPAQMVASFAQPNLISGMTQFLRLQQLLDAMALDGPLENAVAKVFPVAAVKFVHKRGYEGPLFNDFNWGGYLIWSLPQLPVIVDGRTNLHGDERLTRLGATWAGAPGWEKDPDLAAARVVIASVSTPLAELLEFDRRFERVYKDDLAKVFVRR